MVLIFNSKSKELFRFYWFKYIALHILQELQIFLLSIFGLQVAPNQHWDVDDDGVLGSTRWMRENLHIFSISIKKSFFTSLWFLAIQSVTLPLESIHESSLYHTHKLTWIEELAPPYSSHNPCHQTSDESGSKLFDPGWVRSIFCGLGWVGSAIYGLSLSLENFSLKCQII